MTPDEKSRLTAMRIAGSSYTEIADALGLSKNTVKTFCRRNGLAPEVESTPVDDIPAERLCPRCGKPVIQPEGRKQKSSALTHVETAGGTAIWTWSNGKLSMSTPARPAAAPLQPTATVTGNTAVTNAISRIGSEAEHDR